MCEGMGREVGIDWWVRGGMREEILLMREG